MTDVHDPEVVWTMIHTLASLRPDTPARWGELTAPTMLYHLNAGMRIALGLLTAEPVGDPAYWHTKGRAIALGRDPWPEGAPTSAETLTSGPIDFDAERVRFRQLLQAVALRPKSAEWPDHPRLGPFSGSDWSLFTYNHIRHHFRQFGLPGAPAQPGTAPE